MILILAASVTLSLTLINLSIKPVLDLGRAEVIKPEFGSSLLVKISDGSYLPATIKVAHPGDQVTVFLQDGKITNAPHNYFGNYLASILQGLINGGFITYLFLYLIPKRRKNKEAVLTL